MDLLSIHNPSALAEILGVTFKGLNYLLYGQSLDNHYNNFEYHNNKDYINSMGNWKNTEIQRKLLLNYKP